MSRISAEETSRAVAMVTAAGIASLGSLPAELTGEPLFLLDADDDVFTLSAYAHQLPG